MVDDAGVGDAKVEAGRDSGPDQKHKDAGVDLSGPDTGGWAVALAGLGSDRAFDVAVTSSGDSYVTGSLLVADGGWLAIDGRYEPPL